MNYSCDTLVLKLVETYKKNKDSVNYEQNRCYIIYDTNNCTFLVRGGYSLKLKKNDYSFYCDTSHSIKQFLQVVYGSFDNLGISLLNYKYLPSYSEDITYTLLKSQDSINNEIVGYDFKKSLNDNFDSLPIDDYLNILQNVYNDFN